MMRVAEQSTTASEPSRSGLAARLGLLFSGPVWAASAFLLLNGLTGVFWLLLLFALVPLGVGLAYTLVGLVILALLMRFWMLGADLERLRIGLLLGVRIASPHKQLPNHGVIARAWSRAGDAAVWRDLLYLILLFPVGVIEGVAVLLFWGLEFGSIFALISLPGYWLGEAPPGQNKLVITILLLLICVIAFGLALVVPQGLVGLARGHAQAALRLIGPRVSPEKVLAERVEALSESRTRLLDAAMRERQRIERDLHDGAQQRLVAVAMGLGLAREKLKSDPATASALVEEAHEQTKEVIREIRDLVRGLHPAVLSDRGLDAAISALAGRSLIPVELDVNLPERLHATVESTAYYVVAEALTNIVKHSRAEHAWVSARCAAGRLYLEVKDDGIGGAESTIGGGLAGLADRVLALDGRLVIESPAGGPTKIKAELPCE